MAVRRLKILVFREPHGKWTARVLEHDLSAEGPTREAAIDLVLRLTRAHIAYDIRHNREPLSAFGPAPMVYWSAFPDESQLQSPQNIDSLDDYMPVQILVGVAKHHPTILRLVPIEKSA